MNFLDVNVQNSVLQMTFQSVSQTQVLSHKSTWQSHKRHPNLEVLLSEL